MDCDALAFTSDDLVHLTLEMFLEQDFPSKVGVSVEKLQKFILCVRCVCVSLSLSFSLSISFWSCVATETVSNPVAELDDGAFICLHPATYLVSQSASKLFPVIHIDRPPVYLARSWARDLGCAHKSAHD